MIEESLSLTTHSHTHTLALALALALTLILAHSLSPWSARTAPQAACPAAREAAGRGSPAPVNGGSWRGEDGGASVPATGQGWGGWRARVAGAFATAVAHGSPGWQSQRCVGIKADGQQIAGEEEWP